MNWQGHKVLVTGAGGFIGSTLVERLVELGAGVRAFVRYTSRQDIGLLQSIPKEKLASIETVAGDLRDPDAVRQAMKERETVFHLGALISIPYSYVHRREVIETNILGTLNILEAAQEYQPRRIVHTSSSEVYGTALDVPMDESHRLQAQSPYAASKIGADHVVESYWRTFGTPAVTVRPFNAYGPGQSTRAVIPTIIAQALRGNRVALGNLHPQRDFTFVTDTAEAFVMAGSAEDVLGEKINVGSGQEISIGELAQKIVEIIGNDVTIGTESQRTRPETSEVDRLLADSSKAERLLGWRPQVSLDEGIKRTIQWMREHPELHEPEVYRI